MDKAAYSLSIYKSIYNWKKLCLKSKFL